MPTFYPRPGSPPPLVRTVGHARPSDVGAGERERLRPLAVKELNLRKKQMAALEREAAKIVADAARAAEEGGQA